jgi:pimeloyl-ACP methyl ester carboxylesterase
VVFTPGAMADHTMFDDQVEAVTARYRMLRWDVRGHGLSRPAETPFSPAQAAEDLAALLDMLSETRVALVGQSIGGNISQDFIFRYPDRCSVAILLDCICSTIPLSPAETIALQLTPSIISMSPMNVFKHQAANVSSLRPAVRCKLSAMFSVLSPSDVVAITKGVASAIHGETGYRIRIPILIAYGDRDTVGNVNTNISAWLKRDPQSTLAVIPDAGHMANMDNPASFNHVMTEFLGKYLS